MTTLQRLVSMLAVLMLSACGGGGGSAGTPPFGGGTPPGPTAADISLTLSAPSVTNSGTDTVVATVTAVDANRNAISGIPVALRVDNGAFVQVSGATTDINGRVLGTVNIGANRANRVILISAVSGTLAREIALQVVGARLTATALPAVLDPSATGHIQYLLRDANGNPMTGLAITITGPGGVESTAQTGPNGDYEYAYTAPAAAGNLDIRANAGGVSNITTIIVQSGPSAIPPVPAGSVRSASVRANPSVVPVNANAATSNRSEIRALFVGDSNAPIRNVRVRFDLDGDRNSIGGSFTSVGSLVYSDPNGVASTAYVPGSRFSPTDGVTVRACWDYTDFAAGTCPNAARTTLTVISDAISVTLGTDELIVTGDLVYIKRFIVQVNDSSGLARPDVQVDPLLDLPSYSKGSWSRPGSRWIQTVTAADCGNEDLNRNFINEIYSNGQAEDANGNATLDPRKGDVAVAYEGSSRTNSSGQVTLRITYPRNVASWLRYSLSVTATGVSGTEGRASFADILPVPIAAVTAEGTPAFALSPYGVQSSSTVFVQTPDGSAAAFLCTNPN